MPRTCLSLGVVTLALVAMALVGPWARVARAQSVELAGERYLGADFEGARREARRVLAAETSSREDVVGALRLLVALETILGQPDRAAEAARLLVLIDASAEPAAGAPEEAAAAVAAAREAPRPTVTLAFAGGAATATATEPPALGVVLEVECDDATGPHATTGPAAEPLRQRIDATHDARCEARLRTAGGIVLAEVADDFRPGQPGSTRGATTSTRTTRSGSGLQGDDVLWIALGIAGGVILTATLIGVGVAASGPTETTFGAPVVIGW